MDYNRDKVDAATLALLFLVASQQKDGSAIAWKGYDKQTIDRLVAKGLLQEPGIKSTSYTLSPEGYRQAGQYFQQFFGEDT